MEPVIMVLVLAGVFISGFFVVDYLGRSLDGVRRDQHRRTPENRKNRRPERFLH